MWVIQLLDDVPPLSPYDFAGHQILETHIERVYNSLERRDGEDYKDLLRFIEEHITRYINDMPSNTVELYVYNYGIDNAIALQNRYSNKSSRSLLFAIFSNRFSISYLYMPDVRTTTVDYTIYHRSIRIIQQFWRRVLAYRNKQKKYVIENEITYLIEKINKEIVGESTKKVLIFMVNKFRRRLRKTLSL